jgi:fucose permease
VLPLGFAAFLAFGVVLVLVGANQAALARDLSLDLSRTGLLGSALVLGIGLGVVGAGPLVDRYPRRPLWVLSTGLAGAALLGVSQPISFGRMLAQLALIGLALGLYDTLVSTLVAQRFRERALRPMSVIHSAATLGAMLGPPLAAWLAARGDWTLGFHAAGYAHLALAGAALWLPLPGPDRASAPVAEPARGAVFSRALIPFALASFGYVGIESALTVFAVPYASQGHGLPIARGLASITSFWMGLFAGRLIPLLLPFAPDARWIAAAGAGGAAALAGGRFLPAPELVFGAAGLALGCVYPLAIGLAAQRFPEARGTATGLTAGAGALGGFSVPWLHGALGDRFGASAAVAALALWSLLVGGAALWAGRRTPGSHSA